MTIEFLTQSPSEHETTKRLSSFLSAEEGRIFLLTGNLSDGTAYNSSRDFLSLIEWAAGGQKRELVVLVGAFTKNGNVTDASKPAEALANLMVQAADAYMRRQPEPPAINVRISFYAIEKWHAKAICLTGFGGKFNEAKRAIFGSTNFSESALHGKTFEFDTYIDDTSPAGEALLKKFIVKINGLIKEGMKTRQVNGFQQMVETKIDGLKSSFLTMLPVLGGDLNADTDGA